MSQKVEFYPAPHPNAPLAACRARQTWHSYIATGAGATDGDRSSDHTTGATSRITSPHERAASTAAVADTRNASEKEPVRSTIRPVTTGAAMPASWPAKFCAPAHRPAACGPDSVAPTAKIIGVDSPKKTPVSPSSQAAVEAGTY